MSLTLFLRRARLRVLLLRIAVGRPPALRQMQQALVHQALVHQAS